MSKSADQFRELAAPFLAQVQAIADSRPELKGKDCRFTCRMGHEIGLMFAAFFDYGDHENTIGVHGRLSPEEAITGLAVEVSLIPKPPTRAELIAQKKAELAELEGGES